MGENWKGTVFGFAPELYKFRKQLSDSLAAYIAYSASMSQPNKAQTVNHIPHIVFLRSHCLVVASRFAEEGRDSSWVGKGFHFQQEICPVPVATLDLISRDRLGKFYPAG